MGYEISFDGVLSSELRLLLGGLQRSLSSHYSSHSSIFLLSDAAASAGPAAAMPVPGAMTAGSDSGALPTLSTQSVQFPAGYYYICPDTTKPPHENCVRISLEKPAPPPPHSNATLIIVGVLLGVALGFILARLSAKSQAER